MLHREMHLVLGTLQGCSVRTAVKDTPPALTRGWNLYGFRRLKCLPPPQELQATWRPITFTVDAVALISRSSFHDPFRIRWQIGLGSGTGSGDGGSDREPEGGQHAVQKCREVGVPYVATCGAARTTPDDDSVSYHVPGHFGLCSGLSPVWVPATSVELAHVHRRHVYV